MFAFENINIWNSMKFPIAFRYLKANCNHFKRAIDIFYFIHLHFKFWFWFYAVGLFDFFLYIFNLLDYFNHARNSEFIYKWNTIFGILFSWLRCMEQSSRETSLAPRRFIYYRLLIINKPYIYIYTHTKYKYDK